jgi:hypothetical protein
MIYLTILNTLVIFYLLLVRNNKYYFELRKDTTFSVNTLVGYQITLWKKKSFGANGVWGFYIPIRNKKKVELKEEVDKLINKYSKQNQQQSLNAIFSWLKTWEEVKQFKKDYYIVNPKLVDDLVTDYAIRHNCYF